MTQRPSAPLVIKCNYDQSSRRIAFPSASTCRLDALRARVAECFHLSALGFYFQYTDDDGEDFAIRHEADLTDAILYFVSGDDGSVRSGREGKINVRLEVVVEYDGPSLSDTSSLRSFGSGSGSGSGSGGRSGRGGYDGEGSSAWGSSYYSSSYTSGSSRPGGGGPQTEVSGFTTDTDADDEDGDATEYAGSAPRLERAVSGLTLEDADNGAGPSRYRPLTGPDSAPAPSLLTHSELGSRWLREQTTLARRKFGRPPLSNLGRRYDSDEESLSSGERELGDINLVKDERGRYYYAYETEPQEADPSITHLPLRPDIPVPGLAIDAGGPPLLAPDCSACGVRLEYMRYVCTTCGEGDLWKADAHKPAFVPSTQVSPSESAESDESDLTEWAGAGGSAVMAEADGGQAFRHRSSSMSTRASREAVNGRMGAEGSGDGHGDGMAEAGRGYELCPACIETHGIAHAKAAAKVDRTARSEGGRRRRSEMRHAFREMIWGPEGWSDIEYSEDGECTICRSFLSTHRFKCVSCTKFDLCRACYYKVGEIHPAHAFLSLPDIVPPDEEPPGPEQSQPRGNGGDLQRSTENTSPTPPWCILSQDIVGPRFHCAVCPSWDLCIQCESLPSTGEGGHTADHIMMKIPVPLATSEVEAVSRRARSRWFEQDSSTVAAAASVRTGARTPSPTNETVYAGTSGSTNAHAPASPGGLSIGSSSASASTSQVNARARDQALALELALDHGVPCSACGQGIKGRRFECANCPTLPAPYSLCAPCELRSYRLHPPTHVFLKFDRPVHSPTPRSAEPLLPLLTRHRAGDVPPGAALPPRSTHPQAYLAHVLHRETLCDVHSDQIRGVWLRCVHCQGGFDTCAEGEGVAEHDGTHVFLAFKSRVDMATFRGLAGLTADRPRPLITHRYYNS